MNTGLVENVDGKEEGSPTYGLLIEGEERLGRSLSLTTFRAGSEVTFPVTHAARPRCLSQVSVASDMPYSAREGPEGTRGAKRAKGYPI
jgi:hypothetical protein